MELVDKKVYRLDQGDFYSFIDYCGYVSLYGVSQDSVSLINDTCAYVKRFLPRGSICRVSVVSRSSLGTRPVYVFSKEIRV